MVTKMAHAVMLGLAGLAALTVSCGDRHCNRTQFPEDFSPEARQQLGSFGFVDGTETIMCNLGQYRVVTVTAQGEQTLLVFQGETPLYSNSAKGSDMSADGWSVATLLPPRVEGGPRTLVYHGYDRSSHARVMVFDRDLDGQPDLRARTHPDKRVESEVWYQDRWQRVVDRGGERGIVVDGQFMVQSDLLDIQQPDQAGESQP